MCILHSNVSKAALSVVFQTKIHNFVQNMSFFIFLMTAKSVLTKESIVLHFATLYLLRINFKRNNHGVEDLVFWLKVPKPGENGLFSPSFMLVQRFVACGDYSTICMTHILTMLIHEALLFVLTFSSIIILGIQLFPYIKVDCLYFNLIYEWCYEVVIPR